MFEAIAMEKKMHIYTKAGMFLAPKSGAEKCKSWKISLPGTKWNTKHATETLALHAQEQATKKVMKSTGSN